MQKRKNDIICIIGFFVVVAVFFYRTFFTGLLPVPTDSLVGLYHPWRDFYAVEYPRGIPFKNFLITDPIRQQIPWRKAAIDQWKDANLPWWNPYNFSGTPLAANIQAAVFYPFNILFFILPFPIAWTVLILLQPILSGLFLFLYLRHLKLTHWASLLGALTWSFSGFSIAWLTWGTMVHVALWLPVMLLAIDKLVLEKSQLKRWSVTLVCALSFAVFAGHIQISLYVILVATVYALWRLSNLGAVEKYNGLRILSWVVVAAAFVTIVQWLPFIELVSGAGRLTEFDTWTKAGWFVPWKHLVQFVAPDFFGNPATLNYWGEWNYGEFIGYAGVIGLVFAAYSFFTKNTAGRFWKAVLLLALLFMLPNPIAKIPFQLHLPVLATLQPTRLMVLVSFSLAVLSAFGFDAFIRQPKKSILLIIFPGIVIIALWIIIIFLPVDNMVVAKRNLILPTVLFLGGSIFIFLQRTFPSKKVFLLAIIGLIVFDLLRFGWKFTPFTDSKYFFPQTKVIEFLQSQKKPFRVASVDSKILPPNTLAYFGIESIEGYDPITLRSYEEFMAASERGKPDITPPFGFNRIITPHNLESPLLPLLGARYVLALEELNRSYLKKVFQEGETRIYEDSRALPRAYFVEEVRFEKNRQDLLNNLFLPSFQPLKTAYVERPISLLSTPLMLSEVAEIIEYKEGKLILNVQTLNPRFLVISNLFYPGWHAEVDGKVVEIYRTNYLFQGVVVPSGRHTLVLRYRG